MASWQTRKSTFSEKTARDGSAEWHSQISVTTRGDSSADSVGLVSTEYGTTQKERSERELET